LEYLKESFMIEVNLIQERGQKYGGSHWISLYYVKLKFYAFWHILCRG
jgi:hypothetical protein